MLLRMQAPQMIPNTIAGKKTNVITTEANSVVAISTNINTGVGITSRCPYRASAGMGTYQALTKLLPVHTELSSSRPTVWCALNFKPSHNHNLNCTITYMYNNFENMLTAQHQTSLGRATAHLKTPRQRQICYCPFLLLLDNVPFQP